MATKASQRDHGMTKSTKAAPTFNPRLGFEEPIPMVHSPTDALQIHAQYAIQVDVYRAVTTEHGNAQAEFIESNSTNVVLAK